MSEYRINLATSEMKALEILEHVVMIGFGILDIFDRLTKVAKIAYANDTIRYETDFVLNVS